MAETEEKIDQETETQSEQSDTENQSKIDVGIENLKVLENIEVKLTVEVGSSELKIRDLLRLNEGSVVELERLAGDPLDILANGVPIAKGEVVMVGERFGVRFTEVTNPEDTVKKVARGVGKVAGHVVRKAKSERDAVVGAGKAIKKKGTQFKTGLADRIRKGRALYSQMLRAKITEVSISANPSVPDLWPR